MRNVIVVLGDQLDAASAAFDGFDPAQDAVWMAECAGEATYVWSHQARIALFLSAMRHFRETLRAQGFTVHYRATGEHPHTRLIEALRADLPKLKPQKIILLEPGEWRLTQDFSTLKLPVEIRPDRHFLCSRSEFAHWMQGRKKPLMEHFYRWMRGRQGWLMQGREPVGGQWNFDAENRGSFSKAGPPQRSHPVSFPPDAITREVLALVARDYAQHPGSLASFDWPVTREEALETLDDFIVERLPRFGDYQDAMWANEPWPRTLLWHSRLSVALNLHLLDPREVCQAAIAAYTRGDAPLASVEGFVRQILGWREYVRGLYFHHMPAYLDDNALGAEEPLPAFYWSGDTEMRCLHHAISETLRHGYAHHIQRLMVTGLFALLLGVRPRAVHEWYLAVYVDAVEWVELPNTIGMSQHADGGLMGSKPYVASGKYIQRMSNYCTGCRYDPAVSTGPRACPFTTLYWDFLARHEARFANHPRLKMQLKNLARLDEPTRSAIAAQAQGLRTMWRGAKA